MACVAILLATAFPVYAGEDADSDYRALLEAWKGKEYSEGLDLAEAFLFAHPGYKYESAVLYIGAHSAYRSKLFTEAVPLYRRLLKEFPRYKKARSSRDEL
ncbi:MAG: tetratricopeptide repeat protein, partial [Planctomycetota bacterium]